MESLSDFDWRELYVRIGLVARALTGDLEPAEVVDIVVRQGMAGMGAMGAHAGVARDGYLHPIAAIGTSARVFERMGALTLDRSIPTCLAVRTGAPVWITNRADGLRQLPDLAVAPSSAQAWAALPLIAQGRPFGALGLSFEREMMFDDNEQEWCSLVTDVAALALSQWCARQPAVGGGDPAAFELDALLSVARLEGVVVVDAEGVIVKANDRLCEMFGYLHRDLIGRPVELLVPTDQRAPHAGNRLRYFAEPGPRPMGGGAALRGLRADGSTFPLDISLSPCTTPLGLHVLAVVRDESRAWPGNLSTSEPTTLLPSTRRQDPHPQTR